MVFIRKERTPAVSVAKRAVEPGSTRGLPRAQGSAPGPSFQPGSWAEIPGGPMNTRFESPGAWEEREKDEGLERNPKARTFGSGKIK